MIIHNYNRSLRLKYRKYYLFSERPVVGQVLERTALRIIATWWSAAISSPSRHEVSIIFTANYGRSVFSHLIGWSNDGIYERERFDHG